MLVELTKVIGYWSLQSLLNRKRARLELEVIVLLTLDPPFLVRDTLT